MSKQSAGSEIERLVQLLARLPGLGHRSARKAALTLIKKRTDLLEPLAAAMTDAAAKIVECSNCGNIDTVTPCTICRFPRCTPRPRAVWRSMALMPAPESRRKFSGSLFPVTSTFSQIKPPWYWE